MGAGPQRQYTLEDYRRVEETSDVRHEFYAGEIFAMAGGSVAHNHICANVLSALRGSLRGSSCSAFGSNMRLRTPAGLLTYPDVMVICGTIELAEGRDDEVTNPNLLVEVLSDATRNYDRGQKFEFYSAIPSLEAILLIEQNEVAIESFCRADGAWSLSRIHSLSEVVTLPSIGAEIAVAEVFDRVFP